MSFRNFLLLGEAFPHAGEQGRTDGTGRVDVAAGDVSDRVRQGDDGQIESDGGAHDTGRLAALEEHRGAAAQERQNEGSDAFTKVSFDIPFAIGKHLDKNVLQCNPDWFCLGPPLENQSSTKTADPFVLWSSCKIVAISACFNPLENPH